MIINDKRALAYVVEINDIIPINDADKIETAVVKGWKVVVRKNQFKSGDKAIYFEIDSFLPIKPEFEFLLGNLYAELFGCFRFVFCICTIRRRTNGI